MSVKILPTATRVNTTQRDTRRYFNVRSKADISQLNSPHGTKLKKWKREKLKSEKKRMLGCIGKQSAGNPWIQSWRKKEGYGGKILQKRKVMSLEWKSEGVAVDESGESMEPMEEVPLVRPGELEMERLVRRWRREANTTVGTTCTTNRQQVEVAELEKCGGQTCSKLCAWWVTQSGNIDCPATARRPSQVWITSSIVDSVLLTTHATRRCEIFQVQSLGQSSGGKSLVCRDIRISLWHSVELLEESTHASWLDAVCINRVTVSNFVQYLCQFSFAAIL